MNASLLSTALLIAITVLYAGYNLFVKLSGNHVPSTATSTVLATIVLQIAALIMSLFFLGLLLAKGGQSFQLTRTAYLWAAMAGICIGLAEIGYFYLFGGIAGGKPVSASLAIPVIVSGTVVITMVFSFVVLKESIGGQQLIGCCFIVCGIVLFFVNRTSIG